MNKTTIPIKGMHCRSCELLIEDQLGQVSSIKHVSVNYKKACADISYAGDLNHHEINDAVVRAGYEIGVAEKKPFFAKNSKVYFDLLIFGLTIYVGYMLLNIFGIKITTPAVANNPSSLLRNSSVF